MCLDNVWICSINCIVWMLGIPIPCVSPVPKARSLGSLLWTLDALRPSHKAGAIISLHWYFEKHVAARGYSTLLKIVEFMAFQASSALR